MRIYKAKADDAETVMETVHNTIKAVYPKYYPKGAVDFFLKHHSKEKIEADISAGKVYLLEADGKTTGTVTVDGSEIGRLFVLPECQGKGFGGALLSFAEEKVFAVHSEAVLDASFSAKGIYLKKGYVFTKYNIIETDNGDYLCFDEMKKEASGK